MAGVFFNVFTGTFDFTGSSGGGGGTISGTIADTQIAFGTGVDTIGGSADLTFAAGGVTLYSFTPLPAGQIALTLAPIATIHADAGDNPIALFGEYELDLNGHAVVSQQAGYALITDLHAQGGSLTHGLLGLSHTLWVEDGVLSSNVSGYEYGTVSTAAALAVYGGTTNTVLSASLASVGLFGGSSSDQFVMGYQAWADPSSTTTNYPAYAAFYTNSVGGFTANAYPFWADEQGVYRIKADNTFNSVYQAIPALYNPQFTKYTPGAANYERIVEYWDTHVATFGTEAGGTGTQRILNLVGSVVEVNGVPITTQTTAFVPSLLLMGG